MHGEPLDTDALLDELADVADAIDRAQEHLARLYAQRMALYLRGRERNPVTGAPYLTQCQLAQAARVKEAAVGNALTKHARHQPQ